MMNHRLCIYFTFLPLPNAAWAAKPTLTKGTYFRKCGLIAQTALDKGKNRKYICCANVSLDQTIVN